MDALRVVEAERMSRGVVIGRFMPLHAGHMALIGAARALVDQLTIIMCWQPDDAIAGALRLQSLLETYPSLRVMGLESPLPCDAGDTQGALEQLAQKIGALHGDPIDRLIACDRRQAGMASALDTRFVLIDPDHQAVPIESNQIRADPMSHWAFLAPSARPLFASTICLHGPESTGKTTLAPALARHFDTLYVPEYGRTYCEQYGLSLGMDDLVTIGKTHHAQTRTLLRQCNRRLILDTDPLMTAVWADMLFERRDPWFDAFESTANLYLLMDIDMPWIDDGTRFFGGSRQRQRFFDLSLAELGRRNLDYRIIRGPAEERFGRALQAIADAGL